MPRLSSTRLDLYLKTGELPRGRYHLSYKQRAEIVHAPGDELTSDLAKRIGAGVDDVREYRVWTVGLASMRVYIRPCFVCGQVFSSARFSEHLHPDCRKELNARWSSVLDKDTAA